MATAAHAHSISHSIYLQEQEPHPEEQYLTLHTHLMLKGTAWHCLLGKTQHGQTPGLQECVALVQYPGRLTCQTGVLNASSGSQRYVCVHGSACPQEPCG